MGACASSAKRSSARSSRKLRASLVHTESHNQSDSIVNDKSENVIGVVLDQSISSSHAYSSRVSPFKSVSSFSNHGSKEEAFFDSQPWLESDCDEDFYSVNGDFTSSRGSTPAYRSFPGTPLSRNLSSRTNRALFEGTSPPYYTEPNRTSRGSTPLHRSASAAAPRVDSDGVATTESPPTEQKKRKKLGELFRESIRENSQDEASPLESPDNAEPYISSTKLRIKTVEEKMKRMKSAQWCFPRLPSARGFKKTMSSGPSISVDS